jgi:hypothetical protein
MPTLESKLVIGAKDETGGAFAAIKAHIAALDKQVATFDKLMASAKGVAKANDPLIKSIAASSVALKEQRDALSAAGQAMVAGAGSTDRAAAAQGEFARETARATETLVAQGETAAKVSRRITELNRHQVASAKEAAAARKEVAGVVGGGVAALAGAIVPFAIAEGGVKALEASASLEQLKFRVREVSGADKTESPFAEQLAADVAAKYPAITQAKALDTYLELRGNAANQNGTINQETARRNLMTVSQAQTAALSLGTELTPEDAQNLLKAVEGSGRAGDPTAVGKMFDAYIRAKQVFGSAIDSSKIRDYVQNAKGANFGIGEEQFFWQNIVRMTEGNASRLGNETAQTLQTLVGGHATKQTARWLVDMGLATGFTPQGGGAATIHGLAGSGTLQVDQLTWATDVLLPALKKHGVLSDENIKNREALLRKDNPNIDERALRERAEAGLISAAIAQSGMRTTVTDNLAHAIANELLISRDVAQMKNSSGMGAAADIGKNPVAALTELTGAISNFGAVVGSPLMAGAAKALDSLAHAISDFTGGVAKEQQAQDKGQPSPAGEDARRRLNRTVFGKDTDASGLDLIWEAMGWGPFFKPPSDPAALLESAREAARGHALMNLPGPPMALPGAMPASPIGAGITPYGPTPPQVSVSGQAQVEHTVHLDVNVTLDPALRAKIDQIANSSVDFTVPLIGGGTGRMDSDAAPHRGGIGHQ